MGLFDKKYCDICGEKIGLLGNRKLDDGNCCKECAKKLSPWFSERRHSTIESIKEQLQDRENNKELVKSFQITRQFDGAYKKIFIDDTKGQFAIAHKMSVEENPDVLNLSQITGCVMDVKEHRTEEHYKDSEGKSRSFNPPRYKYAYAYDMKITVNAKWFDDMLFDLTGTDIEGNNQARIVEMQNLGNRIIAALTGQQAPMQGNGMYTQPQMQGSNMYGQPQMQENNMYGQQMQGNNMYGQQMQGTNMYGQQMQGTNMYGQQPQMQNDPYGQQVQQRRIRCDKCGWETMDFTNVPKFCPMCGDPIDFSDVI